MSRPDPLDDFDPADFAPDPRPCPSCHAPLDEEASCFLGVLMCPPCFDAAFERTYSAEAVRRAS